MATIVTRAGKGAPLTHAEVDGNFLGINGEVEGILATAWDDLRFPASGLNPPGQVTDPSVNSETGLLEFDNNATTMITGVAQMPHAWLEGSAIRPHVHWLQPAAGDVVWQMEYRLLPAVDGDFPAAWTTITASTPAFAYPGSGTRVMITNFSEIDMAGFTLSSMVVFRISRLGNDAADTMPATATLLEFDIHYQIDARGSLGEFSKDG